MYAKTLEVLGQPATVSHSPLEIEDYREQIRAPGKRLKSTEALVTEVISHCDGDLVYARGVLDSVLRNCSPSDYFAGFQFSKSFADDIKRTRTLADECMSQHSGLVVADGAYISNRALISAALRFGKPVFVLNPDGDFLPLNSEENENYPTIELEHLLSQENERVLEEADAYLQLRVAGRVREFDSTAFAEKKSRTIGSKKKVLFLHVTRDANQIPLDPSAPGHSVFPSFFQWADFCLAEVAKNPDEWFIKMHPSAKFYDGEEEIASKLMEKHQIPKNVLEQCPSTLAILENQWPVFTHSGTIALETACFGYKSEVCSSRYPPGTASLHVTKAALRIALSRPANELGAPIEDPEAIARAKVFLHRTSVRPVRSFSPRQPQPNRSTQSKFLASQIFQVFDMVRTSARRSTLDTIREQCDEILVACQEAEEGSPRTSQEK